MARRPDQYVRPPKCRWCGAPLILDAYRYRVERKIVPCNCHGYGFLHAPRRGWCIHNPGPPPRGTWHQRGYDPDVDGDVIPF